MVGNVFCFRWYVYCCGLLAWFVVYPDYTSAKFRFRRRMLSMRRVPAIIWFVCFFCTSPFLFIETVGGADKAPPASKAAPSVRMTSMRAAGVVTGISDTTLKIERKVMDKVETMEFALEKPLAKIKVGDKVKISYVTKGDKNVVSRVVLDVPEQVIKKVKKPEGKTTPGGTSPPSK